MRRLTYYVGTTIDGFIAGPDGEVDFFGPPDDVLGWIGAEYPETLPTHVRDALGVDAVGTHFDTAVQGRVTYQPALDVGITSPYAHLRQLVVSTTTPADVDPQVEVVAGDPVERVRRLKQEEGGGVWLVGGGRLAGTLLPEVDDLVLKVYPVVAGRGVPLFTTDFSPTAFTLEGTEVLDSGTVVLRYRRS